MKKRRRLGFQSEGILPDEIPAHFSVKCKIQNKIRRIEMITEKGGNMGTLVIRIPEDVNAECEISNSEVVKKLFNILNLKSEKSKNVRKHRLSDDAELTDPLGDDLFGIWKDNEATEDVDQYVRNLRQGRQFHAH